MLCIECGKREAKYDGLCEECFLKKVKFTSLPKHLDMTICPHCHAVKFGGHWESVPLEDALFRLVDRSIEFLHEYDSYELHISHGDIEGEFPVEARIDVHFKDIHAEEVHYITADIHYESCPRCNRFFGNYFEAIIQLRGMRENEVQEILNFVYERIEHHARKNENLFLTKEVEKREGWDLYLSDKREAKKIAREVCARYGASLKESPQLAGRKDGRDLYRVTYAVRLPDYRVGDIVEVEGNYLLVEDISGTFVKGINIEDGRKKSVDSKKHPVNLVVRRDEIEKAIVVYSRDGTVELLDRNNNIIDTKVEFEVRDGSTVRIARIGDDVYVLPE